jgi:hypothetical protein
VQSSWHTTHNAQVRVDTEGTSLIERLKLANGLSKVMSLLGTEICLPKTQMLGIIVKKKAKTYNRAKKLKLLM